MNHGGVSSRIQAVRGQRGFVRGKSFSGSQLQLEDSIAVQSVKDSGEKRSVRFLDSMAFSLSRQRWGHTD